ncbi:MULTISPECIES: putative phage abortive infection protein [Sphingobacterium]|uniref:putative phage abortive infection protein n=1 Tax=Sphingobacterium TaxID=28453 RepID=UPI001A9D9DC7|nr:MULTISPECIES: putative phage abortive infection protein [Sphingobacterium]MCW2260108.1 hypothetical protein [Sphingobacterium kitahiroshimense]
MKSTTLLTVASLGVLIAIVVSWSRNSSIGYAIFHGLFGWLYVIYFVFTNKMDIAFIKLNKLFSTLNIAVLVTITMLAIIPTFYYFYLNSLLYQNNPAETGVIGDTLGGFSAPIIGIAAAILTFLAFWVQYKANQQQGYDLKIERFENKFYEMLRVHRDNVDQISINNNVTGRKTFSRLFSELRFIYFYCLNDLKIHKNEIEIPAEKIYNIAYLIFFFGIGQTSSRLINDILDDETKPIFKNLSNRILETQKNYRKNLHQNLEVEFNNEKVIFQYDYIPFQGHMGNLSHYVRHIFQLVSFVDTHCPDTSNGDAKNNYITTIRSQLSTYEQAFLYYNALSVLGTPWLEKEKSKESLLIKYPILKSLPKPLADFYRTPDEVFGNNEKNSENNILFEWTEIKKRFQNINSANVAK